MIRRALSIAAWPATAAASRVLPGLRILMYHRVQPQAVGDQLTVSAARFEEQMRWLVEHCTVVSLSDGAAALRQGTLQARSVAVTFDDGYLDTLTHALPILSCYRIPATVFVTVDFADGTHRHPRYAAGHERLHLDWNELGEMAADPLIEIGSHTCSHPYLSRLSDARAGEEIARSRVAIESRLGRPVEWFCYPSGDYGERERAYVREAGYAGAVTVAPGANRGSTDHFQLRRTEMTDADGAFELRLKLDGAFDPFHVLLHWQRERRFKLARAEST